MPAGHDHAHEHAHDGDCDDPAHAGHGPHRHDQRTGFERGRTVAHYAADFLRNWSTYDAPFPEKVRLSARNRFIATGLLRGCCGHPGEPGC